jgi:RNA polymerase sigma factor (sigma-70 family)
VNTVPRIDPKPRGPAPNTTPLTAAQQRLVEAEWAAGWLGFEVTANVFEALRRRYGFDQFEQEALYALCESARSFDPVAYPNVRFGAFARVHVRRRLWRVAKLAARNWRVNLAMPVDADGRQFLEPADHRPPEVDPRLRLWCSPDYAEQRRHLHRWYRLVLCLRYVEGLTLDEVGSYFGVTRERIRQHEERAVQMLAGGRTRRRIRRQLATGRYAE